MAPPISPLKYIPAIQKNAATIETLNDISLYKLS